MADWNETIQKELEEAGQPQDQSSSSRVEIENGAHPGLKKVKKLPVVEIFGPTIQGEGFVAGTRTSFIRFGLCDYKCTMCDSMHAVDPERVKANAKWMTPEEIIGALLPYNYTPQGHPHTDWITFSGGNPCIHDLTELLMRIRGLDITHGNLKVAVETQGTFAPDWLGMCDVITVSPKGPGMGEQFEPEKFRDFLLKWKHHKGFNCKVVVFSAQDLEFAAHINGLMVAEDLGDRMYISQGDPYPPGLDAPEGHQMNRDDIRLTLLNDFAILTEDLMQMHHMRNVKFLPQLHVLVWGNKQGV